MRENNGKLYIHVPNEDMKHWLAQSGVARCAWALMIGLAALCGCEKKPDGGQKTPDAAARPEVYTTRGQDPAYTNALHEARAKQTHIVAVQAKLRPQIAAFMARARAALPAGATDDQVRAELDAHPEKYPGWTALAKAKAQADARLTDAHARTRETVRRRIVQEAADRRAVAEGRATAKPAGAKPTRAAETPAAK